MKKINYPDHRKRPENVQPCGTPAAYKRHRYWGEITDQACCDAAALKKAQRDQAVTDVSAILARPVSVRQAVRFRRTSRKRPL